MSDSFYHITESSELNKWRSKTYSFGHILEFLHRMMSWCKYVYSAIFDVMKSYFAHMWDKKIRNGYITWETRVVMW